MMQARWLVILGVVLNAATAVCAQPGPELTAGPAERSVSASGEPPPPPPWIALGKNGMVASDSVYASRAGLEILKSGGNAVDAAVAVSFALAVTRSYSTGLGGGGFMIVHFADDRVVVQDFRETAPAAATEDMYVQAGKADPSGPAPSVVGHLSVAVPGLVAGRCEALSRYGTVPLETVTAPAIRLARDGFPVDRDYCGATRDVLETYQRHPTLMGSCRYVYETHLRGGKTPSPGAKLVQPELANLLEGIAAEGADFFYRGPVSKALTREMTKHGGLITGEDLAGYRVREREPIRSTYRGYEIIGMPPPSAGGVALAETLNILDAIDFASVVRTDPILAVHHQVEAMKHAFADRARWLGDADFARVPVTLLMSKKRARQLAAKLDPNQTAVAEAYGTAIVPDDAGTSHFCVVDRWGNVVVSTETINTTFGSLAAVDEWGLILNNEMDDFVSEPGKPNAYGLVQSKANAIAPGKRPLSSMSPTIVLENGEPFLLLGASGGPRIISSVLNVLLGITDFDKSLERAIRDLRPHHQWQPELVYFDTDPPDEIRLGLTKRGHTLSNTRRTGIVQAILRTKNGWEGASDPRKGGQPAGY